ncbi:DUF4912 domain-containing protein [Paenibacillus marinisediminis]
MIRQSAYLAAWPYRYNHSFIHLMVQTPYTLFAYWELHERRKQLIAEHYRSHWNDLTKQVRLLQYRQAHEHALPVHYSDTTVDEQGSWYFRNVNPSASYRVEYGIMNPDYQFISLLRSEVSQVPRNEPVNSETQLLQDNLESYTSISAISHFSDEMSESYSPFEQFSTYTLYSVVNPLLHFPYQKESKHDNPIKRQNIPY